MLDHDCLRRPEVLHTASQGRPDHRRDVPFRATPQLSGGDARLRQLRAHDLALAGRRRACLDLGRFLRRQYDVDGGQPVTLPGVGRVQAPHVVAGSSPTLSDHTIMSFRYSRGVAPYIWRNTRAKCCCVLNPHATATSKMRAFPVRRISVARSIRQRRRNWCGVSPVDWRNITAKCAVLNPTDCAKSTSVKSRSNPVWMNSVTRRKRAAPRPPRYVGATLSRAA